MLLLYEACEKIGVLKIIMAIMNVVKVICIIAPILLIVMLMIDFGKNVISGEQEEIKKNFNKAIKRVIACMLIFFVPTIVSVIMNMLGDLGVNYVECINNANEEYISRLESERNNNSSSNYNNNNNNQNSNNSNQVNNNNNNQKNKNKKEYHYKFSNDLMVLGHYYNNRISIKKIAIYNENGKRVSNKKFDFTISKPIAKISETGKVEALFAGKATIKATLKKDPSYSIKQKIVIIKSTYTEVKTIKDINTYDLKTGQRVKIVKGTEGVYNGAAMSLPQAHKRIIYYHGDLIRIGDAYYPVNYEDVKPYQYSISKTYSAEVAEGFINSNGYTSATNYLFWISLGTQTNYLFKYYNNRWNLYRTFDINTGDILGLNPGSNGGNCNGSVRDSTYSSGLGECSSNSSTTIGKCHLSKTFYGKWLAVSYAVFSVREDSGSRTCAGTFHEGFTTPKRPKSHGCIRHTSDTMRWIRDHMNELGGSKIINF